MNVPKGKTFYIGKKKIKAGNKIPASLESKFSKVLNKSEKTKSDNPIISESEKKK